MGFVLFSRDGATWEMVDAGGIDTTPYPNPGFVKGIPGSRRMTGVSFDGSCWDLGGTGVTLNSAQTQFLIGGAGLVGGLAAGPLQAMLEVHLTDEGAVGGDLTARCIDSMKYQPSGDFVFIPNTADPNADCAINLNDVVYMINYIIKNGPPPGFGCVE